MTRLFWILLFTLSAIGGCSQAGGRVRERRGLPDLVAEESGDLERCYLPGNPPKESWPPATRTYYYLSQGERIVVVPGRREAVLPLDAETNQFVKSTIDQIQAARQGRL
jgi:hypothetical protein